MQRFMMELVERARLTESAMFEKYLRHYSLSASVQSLSKHDQREARAKKLLTKRLSHVIIPFHPKQLYRVKDNLALWTLYPPCIPPPENTSMLAETQTQSSTMSQERDRFDFAPLGQNIEVIFYSSQPFSAKIKDELETAFAELDPTVRKCFSGHRSLFAGNADKNDTYLRGSQNMFQLLLTHQIGLEHNERENNLDLAKNTTYDPTLASPSVSHVLYMEPDMLPIRAGWLEVIDGQTRYPNAHFWVKGSIFRGLNNEIMAGELPHNRFHINGNAIYNLADPGFAAFWLEEVIPFAKTLSYKRGYDVLIFEYLFNPTNYQKKRHLCHLFQYTDAIQNHWCSTYHKQQLLDNSPEVVLIHGGQEMEASV